MVGCQFFQRQVGEQLHTRGPTAVYENMARVGMKRNARKNAYRTPGQKWMWS